MGKDSKIEWTHHTFNPWWGCTRVSEGCANCYAESMSSRWGHDVWGPGQPRRILGADNWKQPLSWDRAAARDGVSARVFCASMADVFDEEAPESEQERLWELIESTPHLNWLMLTKRPSRAAECLPESWIKSPPENMWLGTSVESAKHYGRIEELTKVPALVHFLSIEPLLGPLPALPLDDVEWVIVGGESGPQARPCHEPWALEILDQCQIRGVPFHFKQWGEWAPLSALEDPALIGRCFRKEIRMCTIDVEGSTSTVYRVGKKRAGRVLEAQHWNELPNPARRNWATS